MSMRSSVLRASITSRVSSSTNRILITFTLSISNLFRPGKRKNTTLSRIRDHRYGLSSVVEDLFHNSKTHACTFETVAFLEGLENREYLIVVRLRDSGTVVFNEETI